MSGLIPTLAPGTGAPEIINRVNSLIRTRYNALVPGRAVAYLANGESVVSDYIVSPTVRRIKRLYEHTGNVIGVEFFHPHGFTAADDVYCRVGGWDGLTHRSHRANNWDGTGAVYGLTRLANGTASGSGVIWGGDPWTPTVIDTTNISLDGSVWKVSGSDPDPVFYHGICYTALIEARAQLNALMEICEGYEESMVQLPLGFMAFLSGGAINHVQGCRLVGADWDRTNIWMGDWFNAQLIVNTQQNNSTERLTLWGNRQFQGSARHAMRIGSDSDPRDVLNVALKRVRVRGSSGYGTNVGKGANKINFTLDEWEIIESNNDGTDIKNNLNGNRDNRITCFVGMSCGLGEKGSNRAQPVSLAANPIATTNLLSTIVVTLKGVNPFINQRIRLTGVTGDPGGIPNASINSKWLRVTAKSGFTATVDTGTAATSTTTGGGSAVILTTYAKLIGKPQLDLRGPWQLDNIRMGGELDRCTGLKMRGGTGSNNNGLGAHYSRATNVQVTDETAEVSSDMKGIAVQGDGIFVEGTVRGIGGAAGESIGLLAGSTVNGGQFKVICEAVKSAVTVNGAGTKIEVEAHDCGYAVYSDGQASPTEGALDETAPFTVATAAANPVVVVKTSTAHGLVGGESVTYSDALIENGLDMNGTAFTVGTILSTTTYEVTATGQTSTATGAFGGPDVEYESTPTSSATSDNEYIIRSFGALVVPVHITTTNTGAKVHLSHSVNDAGVPVDSGTATIWGPSNSGGMWNAQRTYALPTSGSVTLVVADGGKMLNLPSNASAQVTVNLPATVPLGWFVDVQCNNAFGVMFQTTTSGTISDGNNASSNPGTIASSTNGATLRLVQRSSPGFRVLHKTGTWTLA